MTKYIFVTGGVVSGLGKGITAASLGRLLKARGLKVAAQKLDPYINVDPGTMSPYQHGEVYVTEDGAETDLRVLARSVAVATEAARIVPANRTAPRQSDHRILSTRKNPVPVFDISVVLVQQPVPFVALGRAAF